MPGYEPATVWTASLITLGVVLPLLRPLWLWLTEHLPQSLHCLSQDAADEPGEHEHGRLTGREIVARLELLRSAHAGVIPLASGYEAALRVRRSVLDAQRAEVLHWRDTRRLPDESLRILEREPDHEERLLPARPTR